MSFEKGLIIENQERPQVPLPYPQRLTVRQVIWRSIFAAALSYLLIFQVAPAIGQYRLRKSCGFSIDDDYISHEGFDELESVTEKLVRYGTSTTIVWDRLAEMTDLYGPRLAGSKNLVQSIDWILNTIKTQDKKLHVFTQDVNVTYWRRGHESLTLLSPTRGKVPLPVLGLGGSISTPKGGIEAEVISVASFEELEHVYAVDKIVLFDYGKWEGYDQAVQYRVLGPQYAKMAGAKAALVRSATPFSLGTVHTGSSMAADIPAAAIAPEHAEYLTRLYKRSVNLANSSSSYSQFFEPPYVHLELNSDVSPAVSKNVIIELKGRDPVVGDEIVLVSGHIDSWDVGMGAVDDGGGSFIAWEAVRLISLLKQAPKRTVRAVLFTNEENGLAGSKQYVSELSEEQLNKHVLAIESDIGVFEPWGLIVTQLFNNPEEERRGKRFYRWMQDIGIDIIGRKRIGGGNTTAVEMYAGEDIAPLCQKGVNCAGWVSTDPITHELEFDGYFYFHHTNADTMTALDSGELAASATTLALWAYSVAELDLPN